MQELSSLIKKCWSGTASTAEWKELLYKLDEDEDKLYQIWMQETDESVISEGNITFDKLKIKELIAAKIATQEVARIIPMQRVNIYRKLAKWCAIAAVLSGVFFTGWYYYTSSDRSAQLADSAGSFRSTVEAGAEPMTILLKDSSEVVLYPGSFIEYDTLYNAKNRKLYLHGKAKFTVRKNKEHPFIVYTGDVSTTALGTVFEVSERNDSTIVFLFEGAVKVQHHDTAGNSIVYLLPGQKAISSAEKSLSVEVWNEQLADGGKKIEKNVQQITYNDGLTFKQMPLERVFRQLTKQYKVEIHFNKDDLAGMMFTGKFEASESVESILNVIASINNLKVDTHQKGFTIKK